MNTLAPLTPADCDLQDYPAMMMHVDRLLGSEFDAVSSDTEWRLGVTLWLRSFHQVPAGSLPADDVNLAKLAGLGRAVGAWKKVREGALRGWTLRADGRLYHPVVATVVLEAWLSKLAQRLASDLGNAKRWKTGEVDEAAARAAIWASAELLRALSPASEVLKKQYVIKSNPTGIAVGVRTESRKQSRAQSGRNAGAIPREDRKISKGYLPQSGGRARPDGHAPQPGSGEAPAAVWRGPPEVRAAFVETLGEDWAHHWIDPQGWTDVPQRALVCRTNHAVTRIRQAAYRVLEKLGVALVREPAKAVG